MSKDINDLRKDIYKNNPNSRLLEYNDKKLLVELYYTDDPLYSKTSEQIKSKYKTFDDWENSFAPSTKSAKDLRKEKELKESPYNTKFVESISDLYKRAGSPKISPTPFHSSLNSFLNLAKLKAPGQPSIMEGIAGDTQKLVGTALDWATLGKARGPVGQTVADLGTLSKEMVIGADKLQTVRTPTPGKSKKEFKHTEVVPQETLAGNITRGIGGYMVPFTGALKAIKAGTQATKLGTKLFQSKPKITKTLQLYGAVATTDQLVFSPEHAFMGRVLGNYVGKDKEKLQTVLDYVSAGPDKTEGENRVALLFDSIFLTGAIGGLIKIGGIIFRSGKEMFQHFKSIKTNGTKEQKNQAVTIIEDASQNNPNSRPRAETVLDDIEIQETKFNSKLNSGTSWKFSEKDWQRRVDQIFSIFTKSRGTFSPKGFFTLNLNKNAAIATSSRGFQIKNEIDSIAKKLIKDGKYTADELDEIITVYLTQPNKDITKLIQKVFTKEEFNAFIKQKGKQSKFTPDDLPIELKALVEESRGHIDDLSKILIGSDYITPELRKEIIQNYGSYLRQSYKKFTNPNYKPSQEVFDEAVVFISKQLKNSPANKNKSDKVLEEMATAQVNIILKTARFSDDLFSFIDNVKAGKTGDVVFAERQKIAKEIQNLLGIETQASSRIFNSMTDLSQFISRQQTSFDLKQLGYNKYFFDDARGIFDTQINGKQYGALDGMFTTKEMSNNFLKPLSQKEDLPSSILKYIFTAKGFAQATKTVGNNITHVRNFESSGLIVLSNGINPMSKTTYNAIKTTWSTIKPTDNKAINDLYNEYLRLGITNQNARYGDIKRLINDANKHGAYNFFDKLASKSGIKYLAKQAEKAYIAEDDIWKIVVYENELATLKKAYPQTAKSNLESLKLLAANKTRNTMPTYDMVPSGFKMLRYTPWGNYFSFHAERFRNTFHTYKIAMDEIKSGNPVLKQRGYKRLGAQITVGQTGTLMVASASMYHTGVTSEEDTHIKNLFKKSYTGNNLLYDVQDSSGKLLFADPKYTDPSAPVNDVMLAPILQYLNDDNMTQPEFNEKLFTAFRESLTSFYDPFFDSTIFYNAVQDVTARNGQTEGPDGELYRIKGWDTSTDNFETKLNNFMLAAHHIAKDAFMPVVFDNIKNTIEINKEQPDKYGVVRDKDLDKFKNLTGINYQPIDDTTILKRVSQKARSFNFDVRGGANPTLYANVNEPNITIAQIKHDYVKANREYYLYFTDLKRTVNSAKRLTEINPDRYTVTVEDIAETLKEANISQDIINNLLLLSTQRDKFVPLKFSDAQMDKLIKMNPTINKSKLKVELNNLRFEFLGLPLLDVREDYTESQKKSLDILYERKKYSKGEEVQDKYPVPFVKKDPADRINPYTGEPYQRKQKSIGGVLARQLIRRSPHLSESAKQTALKKITAKPINSMTNPTDIISSRGSSDKDKLGEFINLYAKDDEGMYSTAVKSLIEDTPDNLKGKGLAQFINSKKFKSKVKDEELNILNLNKYIDENPQASLEEVIEYAGQNKTVVKTSVYSDSVTQGSPSKTELFLEAEPVSADTKLFMVTGKGKMQSESYVPVYTEDLQNVQALVNKKDVDIANDLIQIAQKDFNINLPANLSPLKKLSELKRTSQYPEIENTLAKQIYAVDPIQKIVPNPNRLSDEPENRLSQAFDVYALRSQDGTYRIYASGEDMTPRIMSDRDIPQVEGKGYVLTNEAETKVQMQSFLEEEGLLKELSEMYEPKWKNIIDGNMPGGSNYREFVFNNDNAKIPSVFKSDHFPQEKNYIAHALVRDRKFQDGSLGLHIDELQSDLHQRGSKYGYRTPELEKQTDDITNKIWDEGQGISNVIKTEIDSLKKLESVTTNSDILENIRIRLKSLEKTDSSFKMMYRGQKADLKDSITDRSDELMYNLENNIERLSNLDFDYPIQANVRPTLKQTPRTDFIEEIETYRRTRDPQKNIINIAESFKNNLKETKRMGIVYRLGIDDAPFKETWHQLSIKKLLKRAVDEGYDSLSISNSKPIVQRYAGMGDEGKELFYDKKVKNYMQKLAKSTGGEFKIKYLDIDYGTDLNKYVVEDEFLRSYVIEITPELKELVSTKGLASFRKGGKVSTNEQMDRLGFRSGESVSNNIESLLWEGINKGGELMGVGGVEQRANEKQAAAIVNQMVAAGTVPKYESVSTDKYGFLDGKTGDVFDAVNHSLLSATYGDKWYRRGALQAKEVIQGYSSLGHLDSTRDSYNNRVGFKIRETAKTPKAIEQEIKNGVILSYEKMKRGEALIPGEDLFLNPNDIKL